MRKLGGIIGILGGTLGVIVAALITTILGEDGAFVGAGSERLVDYGWGGIFLSLLVIVFGTLGLGHPRGAGFALILVSMLGAILGGMLVPVVGVYAAGFLIACMGLSLIGGALAVASGKKAGEPPVGRGDSDAAA